MPELSLTNWNALLNHHRDAHILQSGEWGELKSAFGWRAVRVTAGDIGAQILFRRLLFGFTIAYMPKGPLIGAQAAGEIQRMTKFWSEADRVCRERRAVFLKIEPDCREGSDQFAKFSHQSLVASPHNIQPPRSIIVDLRGSEDEILARMKQKTRYNIRLAAKKGVTVRASNDIEAFHKMALVTGGRDAFGVHSLDYYGRAYELFHPGGTCELLVAEYESRPLAALMVFARGRRAWYMYGASSDEERSRMPAYLLQWEAMRWAKARGCEAYDLWGVPDEDERTLEAQFETRHDGLWGVYRFKRGFGGEIQRAAQAMDRVYQPLLYRAYLWRVGRGTGGLG